MQNDHFLFCLQIKQLRGHFISSYEEVRVLHFYIFTYIIYYIYRDGQNHHMLMILKSKSNHLNKGDLKSKSKSFWKW